MPAWDAVKVIADSEEFTAGETRNALIEGFRTPVVCVALEDIGGLSSDTMTIEIVGEAGTYTADESDRSSAGSYTVEIPQAKSVSVTSSDGATYSIEVRSNPS